jgi:ankyrin repeat protein
MEKRCECTSRRIAKYAKTTELIDVILKTGQFDINGVDNDGETPLHYAINGRNPTIARHLIQMGADPKISNYNGITPLESKAMDLIELITNSYRSQGGFCWKYFLKILSF